MLRGWCAGRVRAVIRSISPAWTNSATFLAAPPYGPLLIQPLFGLPFSGCEGRGLRIECEGIEHVAWVQNHDALPGHLNCMHEGRVQIDESTADLIGHIADGVR